MYETIQELYILGQMYRTSESELAKENYEQVANTIIIEEPEHLRGLLEKIWEFEIE